MNAAPSLDDTTAEETVVLLPALDEIDHIAATVQALLPLREAGTIDRILVVDGGSTDGTQESGRAAGAEVVSAAELVPEAGVLRGKGDSIWRALTLVPASSTVLLLDADIKIDFERAVPALLAPLRTDPRIRLVKGTFRRVAADGTQLLGGRVTEVVARPLLACLAPHLGRVAEPLSGQIAVRASTLRTLPMLTGYGVDLGLLADVDQRWGSDAVATVDIGDLYNSPSHTVDLTPMAHEVMAAALLRYASGVFDEPTRGEVLARCRALVTERPPHDPQGAPVATPSR